MRYYINTFTGKNVYKGTGVLSYSNLHNILKFTKKHMWIKGKSALYRMCGSEVE